jgi:hypothetical protein
VAKYHRFDPDILNNVLLLILTSLCPIHKTELHFRLSFKQFLHERPGFWSAAKNSKSAQAARNRRPADRIARPWAGHWKKRISPD